MIFILLLTGNAVGSLPVFIAYMSLKISNAKSGSPDSMRNLGLSGNQNNQVPKHKLGMAQTKTNKFQLAKRNPKSVSNLISIGITIHAIPK